MKMLLKFKLDPDLETKFQVYHCSKNVIDLDKIHKERFRSPYDLDPSPPVVEFPTCNKIDEYLTKKRRDTVLLKE